MHGTAWRPLTAAGAVLALVFGVLAATGAARGGEAVGTARPDAVPGGWIGTWSASPAAAVPGTDNGYPNFSIRNVVHTSVGGSAVRVRLSNAFGASPLPLGHVTVAVASAPTSPTAVPGTMRALTFGGRTTVTVPAGAEVLSDGVNLTVPADADLLVTTFSPTPSGPVTYHPAAAQTSFFTRTGDHSTEESGSAYTEQTYVWHYVAEVDVRTAHPVGSVVALGDSITDGVGSAANANHRWPNFLNGRLLGSGDQRQLGVLNAGISGNRLLLDGGTAGRSALARLDRDVLTATGVHTLVVLEGINDIQQDPHQTDPTQLISAYQQLVEQAHARGVRVIGATMTPFEGWRVYSPTLEATRTAANDFIRNSKVFDGVVDFDAAIRDPQDPLKMRAAYDSGDHLHPNDAGYQAMAAAVPLWSLY
ncbi:SGNH/GDSL hydrolase family protein [Solihabitans fulvus]|uniref:SGNH/GDSL hydrolase family protein n=1 Tax=Solihabitans fulvus TaxID=1892852 RepID=A0A5B2X173_9PSEU|nr:SGNH/GDSL hydrolase family protein [Solihabitans fulvus]KAA2256896.1 SGNH/GDSL hydrolase family protein [Solihabitans fulvus]